LSTSAIESIYEQDRRTVRTPRTAPAVAHRHSSFRGWLRWSQIDGFLSVAGRWSAASREFTGQGPEARVRVAPHCLVRLPLRSLAMGALPQPDRPGHLLSQTRGAAGWSLLPRQGLVSDALFYELARRSPLTRCAPFRAAYTLLREERRVPLHPRCLPSPDNPVRGCVSLFHNLSPACGVWEADAFSIFVRPPSLTRWRVARGLDCAR
jgi:hypothetical protein